MCYPNYMIYAAIILAADKLGVGVSCKGIAEDIIFRRNGLPMPSLLGLLAKAAQEAQEVVLSLKLGDKADIIAQNYLLRKN